MSEDPEHSITFFFDENVSHRLMEFLVSKGHTVVLATDYLASGTPDQIVASVAVQSPMVLVTHDRDFRRFRTLLSASGQGWIAKGSGKLQLSVHQSEAVEKVSQHLTVIEFYYRQCLLSEEMFWVEIKPTVLRLNQDPGM